MTQIRDFLRAGTVSLGLALAASGIAAAQDSTPAGTGAQDPGQQQDTAPQAAPQPPVEPPAPDWSHTTDDVRAAVMDETLIDAVLGGNPASEATLAATVAAVPYDAARDPGPVAYAEHLGILLADSQLSSRGPLASDQSVLDVIDAQHGAVSWLRDNDMEACFNYTAGPGQQLESLIQWPDETRDRLRATYLDFFNSYSLDGYQNFDTETLMDDLEYESAVIDVTNAADAALGPDTTFDQEIQADPVTAEGRASQCRAYVAFLTGIDSLDDARQGRFMRTFWASQLMAQRQ